MPSSCSRRTSSCSVEVAQVVRGHRPELVQEPPWKLSGKIVTVLGDQSGKHVAAVDLDGPHPGQVIEPDLVDEDPLGVDLEQTPDKPLERDRDIAETDGAVAGVEESAGDDADRIREVDDPGPVGACSAISSTTGTVRRALARPPAPVVS